MNYKLFDTTHSSIQIVLVEHLRPEQGQEEDHDGDVDEDHHFQRHLLPQPPAHRVSDVQQENESNYGCDEADNLSHRLQVPPDEPFLFQSLKLKER